MVVSILILADRVDEQDTPEKLIQKVYKDDEHVATVTTHRGHGWSWEFHSDWFFELAKKHNRCMGRLSLKFRHALYPSEEAVLRFNTDFKQVSDPLEVTICWSFADSMEIRHSSHVDAGECFTEEELIEYGYLVSRKLKS